MGKLTKATSATEGEPTRLQTRPRFMGLREFDLSPNDLDRFSVELRKEFPTIRFLRDDYCEHWIDREFAPDPELGPNRRKVISETMRPPHSEPMPCAESFRNLPEGWRKAWVEPRGWKPQWSAKPYRRGRYVLLNEPPHEFVCFSSSYIVYRLREFSKSLGEPPATLAEDEVCSLHSGFMFGRYFRDDRPQQEFLKHVLRIARKISSDKLVRVDRVTLRTLPIPVARSMRVGLDALEWTRRDRRHLIGSEVDYFFRAAGAFPDGE